MGSNDEIDIAVVKKHPTKRQCLKCDKPFIADTRFIRICSSCKVVISKKELPFEYPVLTRSSFKKKGSF